MHNTATKIFFSTLLVFVPIEALAESRSNDSPTKAVLELSSIQHDLPTPNSLTDNRSLNIEQSGIFELSPTNLAIESEAHYFKLTHSPQWN